MFVPKEEEVAANIPANLASNVRPSPLILLPSTPDICISPRNLKPRTSLSGGSGIWFGQYRLPSSLLLHEHQLCRELSRHLVRLV